MKGGRVSIPAGTYWAMCRGKALGGSCDDKVYSVQSETTGKWQPISIRCDGGRAPTDTEPGEGVSHFGNCPDATLFRKPKPKSMSR